MYITTNSCSQLPCVSFSCLHWMTFDWMARWLVYARFASYFAQMLASTARTNTENILSGVLISLAVVETETPGGPLVGVCFCDAASGQLLVGQFVDDEPRSQLRTHLTALQPVEVVLPRGGLGATTARIIRACLRSPRLNELRAGGAG